MKKFFKKIWPINLKNNIKDIIIRFPLWVLLILMVSLLFFIVSNFKINDINELRILKIIYSLIITFFLSLWVYISAENNNFSNKNIFQLFPIVFWILFYFSFSNNLDDNFENIIFFILTLSWIISYLFFAPYVKNILKKDTKQSTYYSYFYKISTLFLISFILGWVLFWLWSIGINVTYELFDLSRKYLSKVILNWAIISLSIFTPIFALYNIPKKTEYNKTSFNENKFFTFIIKYAAIPFIFIYFFILYSYTIKVLLNFGEWPKWEVTWMVIWFSIFGYLTYIFSYIFEEKNKFIKRFRKIFPYAVIPQIFMLAYAIYLRINQYDLTINRYFVVIFWLWLLIISLYFIISKKKSLIIITTLLTLFTIIISVWPWSVYNLPESRQLERLKSNLTEAWILVNNEIIPLNDYNDIDSELAKEIYYWIDYLCDLNNCETIKKLFPKIYQSLVIEHNWVYSKNSSEKIDSWEIRNSVTKRIKVQEYYDKYENARINYSLDSSYDIFPINVKWYSEVVNISNKKSSAWNIALINIQEGYIRVNWEKIDINFIYEKLLKISKEDKYDLNAEDLTFETENYKIIFSNIKIANPEYNWEYNNAYMGAEWYILIK